MSIDNVEDISPRVQYEALAAQTTFAYPFPVFQDADLVVDVDGVTQTLTTHYSVTGEGEDNGGEVTFVTPMTGGEIVTIYRDIAIERTTDFQQNGPLASTSFNDELDRITLVLQQLESRIGRALRLPITGEATDAQTQLSPIANWLGKFLTVNAAGVPEPADIVTGTISQSVIGELLYPQTLAESAAGVTPTSKQYPAGNVFRYLSASQIADVLAGTLLLDVVSAITAALSCNEEVFAPDGDYRVDSTIDVTSGKKLKLSNGATLLRVAAASATTPVVRVLGIKAELEGGTISDSKASANGIAVLGHTDNTDDRHAYWWRFRNCNVQGRGQAGDLGVVIPSGQATIGVTSFNYFGTIENINIIGADSGMRFAELANAHNVSNVQFWECRTVCLELRGAYANNIRGMFMHGGLVSGLIGIRLTNKTVGSQESTHNVIVGWTDESGGVLDQSVVIESACSGNTIIGNSNVLGGFTFANRNNMVILDGAMRCGTSMETDTYQADVRYVVANGTAAARKGFLESNNTAAALGADGTLTLTTRVNAGLLIIRNASDGGTALVQVDSVNGADQVSDPDNFVTVGADPGAASSQFWVEADGTSTRITNRYAVSKFIDVLSIGCAGIS